MPTKRPVNLALDLGKTTILEARERVKSNARGAGVICPCCMQLVQILFREMTPSMAYVAILLHRHFSVEKESSWLHVSSYLSGMAKLGVPVRGGDWSSLAYWGILEERPPLKATEKVTKEAARPGQYKMTEKGHKFVKGEIKVPSGIFLYCDNFLGFGKKEVDIKEVLGHTHEYDELMKGNLGIIV